MLIGGKLQAHVKFVTSYRHHAYWIWSSRVLPRKILAFSSRDRQDVRYRDVRQLLPSHPEVLALGLKPMILSNLLLVACTPAS